MRVSPALLTVALAALYSIGTALSVARTGRCAGWANFHSSIDTDHTLSDYEDTFLTGGCYVQTGKCRENREQSIAARFPGDYGGGRTRHIGAGCDRAHRFFDASAVWQRNGPGRYPFAPNCKRQRLDCPYFGSG